jgi:hypothetical protein
MKPRHASAITSSRFTLIHWFTTVMGVLTAVACSIILMSGDAAGEADQNQFGLMNSPTWVVADKVSSAPDAKALPIFALF